MFGLMRAKKCGMSAEEKHFRRLNYCGTCKAIGSLYGQRSRLLLNHDTVFLAEILTALSRSDVRRWPDSFQSYNCLNLPPDEIPLPLEFAATVNLILVRFKLADHLKDSGKKRFGFANRIFSEDFQRAARKLRRWNFPLERIEGILSTQEEIEAAPFFPGTDTEKHLRELARPTARTTAIFFGRGVRLIGRRELERTAAEIGYAFGKLIYLLDAFEDFEKDAQKREFNAFRAGSGVSEKKMSAGTKRRAVSILRELEDEVIERIRELPLEERQKQIFASRLSENLRKKLGIELPVLKPKKVRTPRLTRAEKWRAASGTARRLAQNHSWQTPFVFAFIFLFALAAPAETRGARSARECFDLGFNLMFLGSLLTWAPLQMVAINRRRKKQTGDTGDWCDCCDCCGDGIDCCDCNCCCDGIDCCDGCDCCCGDGCCDVCDCSCD
ncbi:MAG: DUF5685 family protein [Pyrinomonadaceae bacterium]